jgi:hypothetical protein
MRSAPASPLIRNAIVPMPCTNAFVTSSETSSAASSRCGEVIVLV